MVLYNKKTSTILIRNNNLEYFTINNSLLGPYDISPIDNEYNSTKNPIGYFVEYSIKQPNFFSFSQEFLQDNKSKNLKLLQLIYNLKYYNILLPNSLIYINDQIFPVNPYAINDKVCIIEGTPHDNCIKSINQYLRKFALIKLGGYGLNYINLGILIKLFEIHPFIIDEIIINSNTKFIAFIQFWLSQCNNKREAFNAFLKDFSEQLKFTKTKDTLLMENYTNQFWLPLQLPLDLLNCLDFPSNILNFNLCSCEITHNILDNTWQIKDVLEKRNLEDFSIKPISDEDIIRSGKQEAMIDDTNHIAYIGKEIFQFSKLSQKIRELNKNLLPIDFIDSITEPEIEKIQSYMKLFKDALQQIHLTIPFDSVVRYRLIFHLLLLYTKAFDFVSWLNLITKHQKIDYSIVKKHTFFNSTDGVLFIPKDRQNKQSTLKNVYNYYMCNSVNRVPFELYDQKITKNQDYYCVNNKKINQICLVFDLIQDGTASSQMIKYFILFESKIKENAQYVSLYCGNERITLKEIIDANNIQTLNIKSIYAGKKGIDFLNSMSLPANISLKIETPLFEILSLLSEEDYTQIENIYHQLKGDIQVGDYLVIREFNQPKKNIMRNDLMNIEKLVALFLLRPEI